MCCLMSTKHKHYFKNFMCDFMKTAQKKDPSFDESLKLFFVEFFCGGKIPMKNSCEYADNKD